ncbi:hypothetical protein P5G62_010120 [Neobacillus sp. 179-C4.2 HS]|uniref:Core-binding (CB) domain-containing protein n=1 Tax=Neobacillus driksii TaxID=3035913 RepID=A0ABV4YRH4_9BACI|nr:hypothetical protein [Neobacillus sp. 179.-C4.2 HS]MDP5195037.1 hypothetical protein [Neobacillus sp. 179.-C4.2 HS]
MIEEKVDIEIEKSTPRNKKWFYDYRKHIENVNKGSDNYLSTIRTLFKFFNHQDIHTILATDFPMFLSRYENLNYRNHKIEHLKSFFSFLMDNGVVFNYPIIEELNKNRAQKAKKNVNQYHLVLMK